MPLLAAGNMTEPLADPFTEPGQGLRIDPPGEAAPPLATLVLAHGAGAPMDSHFMNRLTGHLVAQQILVVRFEFPYMQRRRQTGRRRPPDRQPLLLDTWRTVIRQVGQMPGAAVPLLIGGKSMGGRLATLVADEPGVEAVCCFGYPFFAGGRAKADSTRPDGPAVAADTRLGQLQTLAKPTLILQGTRDAFGKPGAVNALRFSGKVQLVWLEAGDHDFVPTRASGLDQDELMARAAAAVAGLVRDLRVS